MQIPHCKTAVDAGLTWSFTCAQHEYGRAQFKTLHAGRAGSMLQQGFEFRNGCHAAAEMGRVNLTVRALYFSAEDCDASAIVTKLSGVAETEMQHENLNMQFTDQPSLKARGCAVAADIILHRLQVDCLVDYVTSQYCIQN